jgi:2-phosphoglycerate kinase
LFRRKETLYFSEEFHSKEALIEEYKNDCDVVRKGVTSDIEKCLKEGKSLIVEGFHIDPRLYQKEVAVQVHNSNSAGGGKGGFSGIVVPFLLTLDEKSHWDFMTNSPDPRYRTQEAHQFGFSNLQNVQTYLADHEKEEGVIPFKEIRINLNSFHETLDLMHDIVLKRIEEEYVVNNK